MSYPGLPSNYKVLGTYATLAALGAAHPTGTDGQTYVVTKLTSSSPVSNKYYTWSPIRGAWVVVADQETENRVVNTALTKMPYPYVTGLELKADFALGDLVFNTIEMPNPYYENGDSTTTLITDSTRPVNNYNPTKGGVLWVVSDVQGWWNHPDPEFTDLPRGFGDGSYDVRGRYAARQITLVGSFLPQDPSDVQAARDRLTRATDLVYTGAWFKAKEVPAVLSNTGAVITQSLIKASYVRLNGRPEINTVSQRGRTDFSIGLKAADPIKYKWIDNDPESYDSVDIPAKNTSLSHTGQVTITNTGNIKVPVVLEVTGELTCDTTDTAQIKNTTRGEQIDIVAPQGAEDVISMDTYSREVLFNDVALDSRAKVGLLTTWIYLDPGANVITFEDTSNASSTAVCRVLYRSGWIA